MSELLIDYLNQRSMLVRDGAARSQRSPLHAWRAATCYVAILTLLPLESHCISGSSSHVEARRLADASGG